MTRKEEKAIQKLVFEKHQKKETRLKLALERVKAKLAEYKIFGDNVYAECVAKNRHWTEAEKEFTKDWNQWNDLLDRLEDRLWDNYSDYQSYCFQEFGWCAY